MPAESGLEELSTKLSKFNVSIREYAQSFQEESHQNSRYDSFSILCTHIRASTDVLHARASNFSSMNNTLSLKLLGDNLHLLFAK